MTEQESNERLGKTLKELWDGQARYNTSLGELLPERNSPARWTEILLLGLQAEITEVLRETGWKRHRGDTSKIPRKIPRDNLAYELSDLTKYTLSLWQAWGFSVEEFLYFTLQKDIVMQQRLKQEFAPLPPEGSKVLVVDMDGTLADLRYGLWDVAVKSGYVDEDTPYVVKTLYPDVDLGMTYKHFQEMKERFIGCGEYKRLPALPGIKLVREAYEYGYYIIAVTARPADRYPRLWLDSWEWLAQNNITVHQLHIGGDARIRLLAELAEKEYDVVLYDDDPEIIERTLTSGIKVILSEYPYNAHLRGRRGVTSATSGLSVLFHDGEQSARGSAPTVPTRDADERAPVS